MNDCVTVLIADDHTVVREGLRAMLETAEHVHVVGEARDGGEAVEFAETLRPDVVLMDIRMPILDGLTATRQVKARLPSTSVIIITSYDDCALVVDAVRAGAAGYLLKDSSRELLVSSIAAAASGGSLIKSNLLRGAFDSLGQSPGGESEKDTAESDRLSERELSVLPLLAKGWTNREIGDTLGLAEVTVKKHVQTIIAKMHVSDRTEAAASAVRTGLIR